MSSIKQIQNRLLNKKNSLNKVTIDMASAEKSKNNIVLRKLNQEKGTLGRDIRKLERQLITEKEAYKEKKY
jgi:phenylalanyl-tRNA synthetase alpha subunit